MAHHGFAALRGIKNGKRAKKVFNKMDDNGGGIVLLDEWCSFLKQGETYSGSAIGKFLGVSVEAPAEGPVVKKKPKTSEANANEVPEDKDVKETTAPKLTRKKLSKALKAKQKYERLTAILIQTLWRKKSAKFRLARQKKLEDERRAAFRRKLENASAMKVWFACHHLSI